MMRIILNERIKDTKERKRCRHTHTLRDTQTENRRFWFLLVIGLWANANSFFRAYLKCIICTSQACKICKLIWNVQKLMFHLYRIWKFSFRWKNRECHSKHWYSLIKWRLFAGLLFARVVAVKLLYSNLVYVLLYYLNEFIIFYKSIKAIAVFVVLSFLNI